MMTLGRAGWVMASLAAVALAGCATTPHGGLDHSANRLDRDAQVYAQDAADSGNTDYTEDARDFADRAHEFRRTVEDPNADHREVQAAFEELSRSYHTLRDDVQHADSDEARHDLAPVTQAYLDVEDDMGGAAPSRYSDADDDR